MSEPVLTPLASRTRPLTAGGRAEWIAWSAIAVAVASIAVPVSAAAYGLDVPIALFLGIVQGASVLVTAVRPVLGATAFVVTFAGFALLLDPTAGPWPVPVIGIIALSAVIVAAVLYSSWLLGCITWIAAHGVVIGVVLEKRALSQPTDGWFAPVIVSSAITLTPLIVAIIVAQLLRVRGELGEARHETEVEQERRRWIEERARMAREMHDVVAHGMSLVHMRASSAKYRLPDLDEQTAAEFDGIAAQARAALVEMRGLLGILRQNDDPLTAPQPGLADLPALVDGAREAGLDVDSHVEELDPEPASAVQLALYRVAQEALSNAVRHAPGARVTLALTGLRGEIELRVENSPATGARVATAAPDGQPGPKAEVTEATAPAGTSGGNGIRGMIERMQSVGGTLEHGPTPDAGYVVVARLGGAA